MRKSSRLIKLIVVFAILLLVLTLLAQFLLIPLLHYNKADMLLQNGKMTDAAQEYRKAGSYKDAIKMANQLYYMIAEELLSRKDYIGASFAFGKAGPYSDALVRKYQLDHKYLHKGQYSLGENHRVLVLPNGTVSAGGSNTNGQCDVSDWEDIVAVAVGSMHTLGLRSDGTVVLAGLENTSVRNMMNIEHDFLNVSNVVAIAAEGSRSMALRSDGTVHTHWFNSEYSNAISKWRNIVDVSIGPFHVVGLKSDGTVVTVGIRDGGRCDVSGWTDIVAIAAGNAHTVGLRSDGTVIVAGKHNNVSNVSGWDDIIAVYAGNCTVGLRRDGTIVTAGTWAEGFSSWNDVLTVGLNEDEISCSVGPDGCVVSWLKNRDRYVSVSWDGLLDKMENAGQFNNPI